jgi:hypothetical protein
MDNSKRSEAVVLLDQLDELLRNAKPLPLTDLVRIDRVQFYELLDRLRATLALDEGRKTGPGQGDTARVW